MNIQWYRRRMACASLVAVGLPCVMLSATATAQSQSAVGFTVGAAGVGSKGAPWEQAAFHLGVRADVIFMRDSPRDVGLGPYVEMGTVGFGALDAGAGASIMLPVRDDFPVVISAGALGQLEQGRVRPLISSSLF